MLLEFQIALLFSPILYARTLYNFFYIIIIISYYSSFFYLSIIVCFLIAEKYSLRTELYDIKTYDKAISYNHCHVR